MEVQKPVASIEKGFKTDEDPLLELVRKWTWDPRQPR